MGLFDLFKKKKKEIKQNKKEEVKGEPQDGRVYRENTCELCGEPIGHEQWTKKQGHYFHKKCFKQKEKEVKKEGLIP